jgi:hypothetical protein
MLTPDSLESRWVRREYLSADNSGIKIIPLKLKPYDVTPLTLRDIQPIDASNRSYEDVLSDVLMILRADSQTRSVKIFDVPKKKLFNRVVDSLLSKGSGEINVGGTVLQILYFSLAGLNALGPSEDTVENLLGVFAILSGVFLLRKKQIPATLAFKISAITYILMYGLSWRLNDYIPFAPVIGGIAAVISGAILVLSVRTPKKPVFYASISFALFLFLVGINEIINNFGYYPSVAGRLESLLLITCIATSALLISDL